MATNQTIIPLASPIRFVPLNGTADGFDAQWFSEQVRSWQDKVYYYQKQCIGDRIRFQVQTNLTPVQLSVIDCKGRIYTTYEAALKITSIVNPTNLVYEFDFTLDSGFIKGQVFYFLLTFGVNTGLPGAAYVPWISEPQQVIANDDTTSLLTYSNTFNHLDIVFETEIEFNFRVESNIQNGDFLRLTAEFQDQPLNLRTIKSIPYDQWLFILGPAAGVPDWVARLVRTIFCFDTVMYHGVRYTQPDGQKWTAQGLDNNYPLRGWTCVLQNTFNRSSVLTEDNNSPAEIFAMTTNINTDAFGTFNAQPSNNIISVTTINGK